MPPELRIFLRAICPVIKAGIPVIGPVRNPRIPQTRLAIAARLVFARLSPAGVIFGVLYGFMLLYPTLEFIPSEGGGYLPNLARRIEPNRDETGLFV